MKIVVLDSFATNPGDLSWEHLEQLGDTIIYDRTPPELLAERIADASIVITNKVILNENLIARLLKLRCICVLATGYNNVDVKAASRRGIPVCNVLGYSTASVAQHVFALLLELTNGVAKHYRQVKTGGWQNSKDWSYSLQAIVELLGKTMGIYGFGKIGRKVGEIARAFGMDVIAHHKHPKRDAKDWVSFVSLEKLFSLSDVLSLHAPLTSENQGIVNKKHLSMMRTSAILINTGRGGLVNEVDLKEGLEKGTIAGAGLDVLSEEPPVSGNILIGTKNCIITPHQAWASRESRARLLAETVKNVEAFLAEKPRNVVN